jgi:hypothetical protein
MWNDSDVLSNVTPIKNKEVYPYELLFGCKPRLPTTLRSIGKFVKFGKFTYKANIQSKFKNR